MQRNQKGFPLVALLIVVAIILVLAALAVPKFLQSKMSANEAPAEASIRTVLTANTS